MLDTFWFDDLSYGYPGPNEQTAWDRESYTSGRFADHHRRLRGGDRHRLRSRLAGARAAHHRQRARPALPALDGLRAGSACAVDRGPRQGLCRSGGMGSWLYWGDCHVGMEPYLGSLAAIDAVDKPAADPVTVRALTDFPGDTYRRMRTDWLFPNSGTEPRMGAAHWQKWQ
ncbi:MAG: hypothetical protein M5U09_29425, partial [Gammaproteobacteria bacterium]|nr:hypothetical protein [Gammaproteobacteria bacterium]